MGRDPDDNWIILSLDADGRMNISGDINFGDVSINAGKVVSSAVLCDPAGRQFLRTYGHDTNTGANEGVVSPDVALDGGAAASGALAPCPSVLAEITEACVVDGATGALRRRVFAVATFDTAAGLPVLSTLGYYELDPGGTVTTASIGEDEAFAVCSDGQNKRFNHEVGEACVLSGSDGSLIERVIMVTTIDDQQGTAPSPMTAQYYSISTSGDLTARSLDEGETFGACPNATGSGSSTDPYVTQVLCDTDGRQFLVTFQRDPETGAVSTSAVDAIPVDGGDALAGPASAETWFVCSTVLDPVTTPFPMWHEFCLVNTLTGNVVRTVLGYASWAGLGTPFSYFDVADGAYTVVVPGLNEQVQVCPVGTSSISGSGGDQSWSAISEILCDDDNRQFLLVYAIDPDTGAIAGLADALPLDGGGPASGAYHSCPTTLSTETLTVSGLQVNSEVLCDLTGRPFLVTYGHDPVTGIAQSQATQYLPLDGDLETNPVLGDLFNQWLKCPETARYQQLYTEMCVLDGGGSVVRRVLLFTFRDTSDAAVTLPSVYYFVNPDGTWSPDTLGGGESYALCPDPVITANVAITGSSTTEETGGRVILDGTGAFDGTSFTGPANMTAITVYPISDSGDFDPAAADRVELTTPYDAVARRIFLGETVSWANTTGDVPLGTSNGYFVQCFGTAQAVVVFLTD